MSAKRFKLATVASISGLVVTALTPAGIFSGCSTTELTPGPVPMVRPPEYTQVAHPPGFEVADIQALFIDKKALAPEKVATCDANWRKLRGLTDSEDELRQGAGELIKQDPEFYHWCFYGKIMELETNLKSMAYADEKQKKVLDTYSFLVPIAKAYMREFHDSRYMRWAIRHYRGLSEWVFFRKLDQAPRMTADLVEVNNPFGAWRDKTATKSVLERYRLAPAPDTDPSATPKAIFPPAEETATAPLPQATSPTAQTQAPVADSNRLPAATSESAEPTTGVQVPIKVQP